MQSSQGVLAARRWACWRRRWGAKLRDQGCWPGQGEFRLPSVRFDSFALGEVPAAAGALRAFARVIGASSRTGLLHLGAAVASFAAVGCAAVKVPVLFARRRAGPAVPAGGAGGDVQAAVLEAVPLELPADPDRADVAVDVFPAQADRLGLADAVRERDRPAHAVMALAGGGQNPAGFGAFGS